MKQTINNIKQHYKLILGSIALSLIIGFVIGSSSHSTHDTKKPVATNEQESETAKKKQIWTCSMHPQIKQDKPGNCPICAMELIPLTTMESGDEHTSSNEIVMSETAAKLASIETLVVQKGVPQKSIYLQGKVQADERNVAELTARFGGRIEKLYVNFTGQKVQIGEKLASIYSPEMVSAQRELLEAIAFKQSRPSLYNAVKAKLKLWDLTDAQISAIENKGEPQNYFDVLSPISGTITLRQVAVGDYVNEGTTLFKVIDLSKVWVLFDAYESDLPWIKPGDNIQFTVQALPGQNFNAKVDFIDPFINNATRVAQVRVAVPNHQAALKPEMFVSGILESNITNSGNQILIPKTSVLWTGKRAVVYVKVPNRQNPTFLYRQITLGPEAGSFYVVTQGLMQGEEIATNGVFKIDAASQLEGKPSMMNPTGIAGSTPHDMSKMNIGGDAKTNTKGMSQMNDKPDKMEGMNHDTKTTSATIEHATFLVSGNCEMCKETIEKAAGSLDGVYLTNWNLDTKQMHVSFNKNKVSLNKIHTAIAASGYDTDQIKGNDKAYSELPGCCLYR